MSSFALGTLSQLNLEGRQAEARILLADAIRNLQVLDDQIFHVQSLLHSLRRKREDEIKNIERYRAVNAPHQKLPDELLVAVFFWCISLEGIKVPWEPRDPPWNISRVCSRWRRVALQTPTLWCDIHVRCDGPGTRDTVPYNYAMCQSIAREVLERSAPMQLSLDIAYDGDAFGRLELSKGAAGPVTDLLLPVIARVKHLRLACHPLDIQSFLTFPAGSLRSLQSMEILSTVTDTILDITNVRIDSAHALRSITFGFNIKAPRTLLQFPLGQITHLDIPYVLLKRDSALDILKRCTKLVSCNLGIQCDGDTTEALGRRHPTVHSELVSIKIGCYSGGQEQHTVGWFKNFDLPNLVHFEIAVVIGFPTLWRADCTLALTHSGCLETLVLGIPVPAVEIEAALRAAPQLRTLSICYGEEISQSVLEKMSVGDLVPLLSKLECRVVTSLGLESIMDMLEMRRQQITPVNHIMDLVLSGHGLILLSIPLSERYKKLVQEGWNIEIRYC